jgi:hypothetical protein
MPGDGGYSYRRAAELEAATRKAQEDAEKAATAKVAGGPAPVALTPEQRQANIARDLALSQTRGARPSGQDSQFYQPAFQPQYTNYATTNPLGVSQYGTPMTARSLVDSAYAGIGRYGSGNEMNQVDPGGRQYWESRLASGSLNPQSLFDQFSGVINQARQDPNNPYSQFLQNQTGYSGGYQGFMPQMQNPFSTSGGMGGGTDGGLTPELARTLMQRSMTTGTPTSEFDKYGGYKAVRSMYDSYGGTYDEAGKQPTSQPLQFNPYTNSPSYSGGSFPTQTPFSYQPATTQPQTPFSYQQPMQQQMQTPFSYQTATGQPNKNYGLSYSAPMQLPQYVYDTIRDVDLYQSKPVQAYQSTRPVSSGPSQAIVGRSSQIRGTPNVMAAPVAKAKGGIATLLKKQK